TRAAVAKVVPLKRRRRSSCLTRPNSSEFAG
ncbi:MAG: hypothetical protein ACI9CV_000880, partial [Ilumatobacter sp.]